ncbi:MAG TPA: lipoyl(octanoyl) transferase LipB [bacterium]|nr:lipoyl(octanoyl) transferase LipB [bacterium]
MRTAWFVPCGRLAYGDAWALQKSLLAARQAGAVPDAVLFVEHPPVITLGRAARAANVLAAPGMLTARGIDVFQIERGGDVTYHGPGQLVGYPIVDLRAFDEDIGRYVRALETALIEALAAWGIAAARLKGFPGVWAGDAKVAAIGVAVKRKVTMHGFALNVDPDLAAFDLINPCGLGRPVTSITRLLGRSVTLDEAAPVVAGTLAAALHVRWATRTIGDVRADLAAAAAGHGAESRTGMPEPVRTGPDA